MGLPLRAQRMTRMEKWWLISRCCCGVVHSFLPSIFNWEETRSRERYGNSRHTILKRKGEEKESEARQKAERISWGDWMNRWVIVGENWGCVWLKWPLKNQRLYQWFISCKTSSPGQCSNFEGLSLRGSSAAADFRSGGDLLLDPDSSVEDVCPDAICDTIPDAIPTGQKPWRWIYKRMTVYLLLHRTEQA